MRFSLALVAISLLLVVASPASAEDAGRLTGFSIASWVERDGEPIGPVRALVQDATGYLWLGTDAGLLRFDGVRFATAASLGYELPAVGVRSLLLGSDGSLWIGLDGNEGVRILRHGGVQTPAEPLALPGSVDAMAEDDEGIWAATSDGLHRYADRRWTEVPAPTDDFDRSVFDVYRDRDGTLWIGTMLGLFRRTPGGAFEQVGTPGVPVRAIAVDPAGQVWVTDPIAGFRQPDEARGTPRGVEGIGVGLFPDSRSNLWILTRGQGLWRSRAADAGQAGGVASATVDTGLTSNGLWTALEDREGNVWLGTHHGLNRLTPYTVAPVVGLGLVRNVVPDPAGGVWAGTASGLVHLAGGQRRHLALGPAHTEVTALHADARGTVWVATSGGLGRIAERRFTPVPTADGAPLTHIRSMTSDEHGLWVVDAARGLVRPDGKPWPRLPHTVEGGGRRPTLAYADRSGRLWIAFNGGHLTVVDPATGAPLLQEGEGLPPGTHDRIQAIAEDPSGTVWIGGNRGLTRFHDGRFATLTKEAGLPGRQVSAITIDRAGDLWLAIDGFIARLPASEFSRALRSRDYRMHYSEFDTMRGVAGVPIGTPNAGATRAADERIWFVTGWGLTVVDPSAVAARHRQEGELPVRIEGAVADAERVAPVDGTQLPARTSRVVIDYTALQLTTPTRIRFRYKLEGFDTEWVETGTRRQAFFTNLPPRSYRFLVQAESGDGVWTTAETAWAFSIAPTFYQTYTFYALMLIAAGAAGFGAWRLRLRQVRHEYELVLAERARLSREIHDTLLQNLAGVAIQCAGIANVLERSSPAHGQLVSVRRKVEEYIRDIRQAVWDLRAPALERLGLAGALREAGEQATAGTGIRFVLRVSGTRRPCSAKIETEVLRVGQEGIRNAVRHAAASQIHVDLHFGADGLTLRVSDDGRGFDLTHETTDDHHVGLVGMRERAAEIGGRLRVGMRPAGGTEVELTVPAAIQPAEA